MKKGIWSPIPALYNDVTYLTFKKIYIHLKGAEEEFISTSFLEEMLWEKGEGSVVFPFSIRDFFFFFLDLCLPFHWGENLLG